MGFYFAAVLLGGVGGGRGVEEGGVYGLVGAAGARAGNGLVCWLKGMLRGLWEE
jgi:hypothetical protein